MKLAIGAAWAAFLLCCVYPIVWMLFAPAGSGTVGAIISGFAEPRQRDLLANALALGLGTVTIACAIGCPVGIVLARSHPRRIGTARLLLLFPLVLPSYVPALAWTVVFGPRGSWWAYGLPPAAVVLAFCLFPIVMLATEAAARSVPVRLEEAGRLVATPVRVWWKISLPLIVPSLGASALIVFVLAISDFAVPGLLRVRVYTIEVFTAFAALYDFRLATLASLPIAAVAAVASAGAIALARRPIITRAERVQNATLWRSRAQVAALVVLTALAIVLIALPTAALAREALSSRAPAASGASVEAARNTVLWSAVSASAVVLFAMPLGYWRVRMANRSAHIVETLWVALFAVPATVVGVGIIGVWNRPGLLGDLFRTDAAVLLAYIARFLPVGAVLAAAFLRRIPPAVEEAAAVAGASPMRTFVKLVLPMAGRGMAAVWLIAFILMSGDVALTILVAPPGESNLGVRAYTLIANASPGEMARTALVQTGIAFLSLAAIMTLWRGASGPGR